STACFSSRRAPSRRTSCKGSFRSGVSSATILLSLKRCTPLLVVIRQDLPTRYIALLSAHTPEMIISQLETPEGIEQDQFDRPDTVYVIAVSDKGNVIGCARLLPTEKPYLLGEVFPALLNGLEPPASPEVWELSRFAAVDLGSPTRPPSGQLSSPIAVELLR